MKSIDFEVIHRPERSHYELLCWFWNVVQTSFAFTFIWTIFVISVTRTIVFVTFSLQTMTTEILPHQKLFIQLLVSPCYFLNRRWIWLFFFSFNLLHQKRHRLFFFLFDLLDFADLQMIVKVLFRDHLIYFDRHSFREQ